MSNLKVDEKVVRTVRRGVLNPSEGGCSLTVELSVDARPDKRDLWFITTHESGTSHGGHYSLEDLRELRDFLTRLIEGK